MATLRSRTGRVCPALPGGLARRFAVLVFSALLTAAAFLSPAAAQSAADGGVAALDAVVRISSTVPGDSRSTRYLGTERDGSGVVIDGEGLVLTIGYLIVEAETITLTLADGRKVPANAVAYDHESGFGLVRAIQPLGVKPVELGASGTVKPRDRAVVASWGGQRMAMPAIVASRRTFAGYWEYLLEQAIFTAPPHPAFGGAALLSTEGKLLGIGSLAVPDALPDQALPGNMFVPVDRLKPILGDLLERGRAAGPKKPWIGLNSQEVHGRLFVSRVTEGGPAAAAGIQPGDVVLGVGGEPVRDLESFYKKLWSTGEAGVTITLDVLKGVAVERIDVKTVDRYDVLKLNRSY